MDKIKDILDMLKNMGKMLKDIPVLIKSLLYVAITVPQKIGDFVKEFGKFTSKAKTVYAALLVLFVGIFFGLQILIASLIGISGALPPVPLILMSLVIIYYLVSGNLPQVKKANKQIIDSSKKIGVFFEKAKSIVVPIILLFFGVYISIKYLINYLTDSYDTVPNRIIILIVSYIVYSIVMIDNKYLPMVQNYLLLAFIYIFNNPLIKDIIKFKVKIDEKNPSKSADDVFKWILKNIPSVITTLIVVAICVKIFITKLISYINYFDLDS